MRETIDLTGKKFGDLTVLWEANRGRNGGSTWVCKCSCGYIDILEGNRLLSGHNTHCRYCGYGRFRFFDQYSKVECVLPDGSGFIYDYNDFPNVSSHKWIIDANGYPRTALGSNDQRGMYLYLHQLLLNPPEGMVVDHIDGNQLNNCRKNLRICSRTQNVRNSELSKNNTSGYKGVSFDKARQKWQAKITVCRKPIYLGRYDTVQEAADAYDEAALMYFGEYARTNKMIRNARKEVFN